ncbi:MAG: (d)CMP kinase [Nitrosomonas sp.]|nr:(d)CMP kinase [Nitrosomonas sp.]MDP1950317.1 (d)CMP kinase [Nitrosomonas sp.]
MVINTIPVIAIDGPSASGKGTVAQRVAKALGFHYLDSGALYRLVALKAMQSDADSTDEKILTDIAKNLNAVFEGANILLENHDVSDKIREEACGIAASKIATRQTVRAALMERQRAFRQLPGLVTDGRDMGSVIFPDAILKIFLTASAETRAQRRYNQLMEKGINANITDLLRDIQTRDDRDSQRSLAPLQQGADAKLLDTTSLNIEQAVDAALDWYAKIRNKNT